MTYVGGITVNSASSHIPQEQIAFEYALEYFNNQVQALYNISIKAEMARIDTKRVASIHDASKFI